jgi:hypothetical protein
LGNRLSSSRRRYLEEPSPPTRMRAFKCQQDSSARRTL